MGPKIRGVFMVLFMLSFLWTIIVYFSSNQDMKLTWIFGGASILFYLIYRFWKK